MPVIIGTTLHACTMTIAITGTTIHACTMTIAHASPLMKVSVIIVEAFQVIIVHACAMNKMHACAMSIVHACRSQCLHNFVNEIAQLGQVFWRAEHVRTRKQTCFWGAPHRSHNICLCWGQGNCKYYDQGVCRPNTRMYYDHNTRMHFLSKAFMLPVQWSCVSGMHLRWGHGY